MTGIKWSTEFETGHDAVDYEHRQLIELISNFLKALGATAPSGNMDEENTDAMMGEILVKISSHFALEELEMQRANYGEYEAHKADHERLLDEFRDIMEDSPEERQAAAETLSYNIEQWFFSHFRTFDARLHSVLAIGKS